MLRILHLEDSKQDAELIQQTVLAEGVKASFTDVTNRAEFIAALERSSYDLILADFALPDFDGLSALKLVRQKYPAIGFISLSGSVGPIQIKANFDSGVTDYIPKGNLSRLVETLRREAERHK